MVGAWCSAWHTGKCLLASSLASSFCLLPSTCKTQSCSEQNQSIGPMFRCLQLETLPASTFLFSRIPPGCHLTGLPRVGPHPKMSVVPTTACSLRPFHPSFPPSKSDLPSNPASTHPSQRQLPSFSVEGAWGQSVRRGLRDLSGCCIRLVLPVRLRDPGRASAECPGGGGEGWLATP